MSMRWQKSFCSKWKNRHELFSRAAYPFIFNSACCWMFNTEQHHQSLVVCKHHHLGHIRENIGLGRNGCGFIQSITLAAWTQSWQMRFADGRTHDRPRKDLFSLQAHLCSASQSSCIRGLLWSQPQSTMNNVHIVFGLDPRDSWRLLLPRAYKAPFPIKPASSWPVCKENPF